MAIPGFTADDSIGPTLQVYRSPPATQATRGLHPQNLDADELAADDGDLDQDNDDLEQDGGDLDDEGDASGDEATTEEDSSSGDA